MSEFKHLLPNPNQDKHHAVILIHGLLRNERSMRPLATYLSEQGYDVYIYDYPSTQFTIAVHAEHLEVRLKAWIAKFPSERKFSVIGHSLGAIMARAVLSRLSAVERQQCDKLILLTPPNQGSRFAHLLLKSFPFLSKWIKPLRELTTETGAYVHRVSVPVNLSIGIIAARYDFKAPPKTTRLPCKHDYFLVRAGHAFVMDHKETRRAIVCYLEHGQFLHQVSK